MSPKIKFPSKLPVTSHTKYVGIGSTFFAICGTKEDGTKYIPCALKRGAKKIVIQEGTKLDEATQQLLQEYDSSLDIVENSRLELANYSAKESKSAHKKLKIIGITGTKGKTSTTFMLEHILRKSGYKTAMTSTVYNKILDKSFRSKLTTELPDYLHQFFKICAENGVEYVIMEVAAQALSMQRVAGIEFDSVIFTNFSQEHGEFYQDMDAYFDAKCKIFKQLKPEAKAFINSDDQWCKKVIDKNPNFTTFGLKNFTQSSCLQDKSPDFFGKIINSKDRLELQIKNGEKEYLIETQNIFGEFNAYNVLAAAAIATNLGLDMKEFNRHIKTFKGAPGRLEMYKLKNGASCFIDYAHNPSSYNAVLSTLRSMTNDLTVVFGCGGERAHDKRPIMGDIASKIADKVILTSDNPRSEDPKSIIEDILSGINKDNANKIFKEIDREAAIKKACLESKEGSVIAILGKGPDEYQQIGLIKHPFSEKNIVKEFK